MKRAPIVIPIKMIPLKYLVGTVLILGALYLFQTSVLYRIDPAADPAKATAEVIRPFARQNHFKLINTNSYTGAETVTHPTFGYIYETSRSPREMRIELKQYLESKGYTFYHDQYGEDNKYCDTPVFNKDVCNTPLINDREQGWYFAAGMENGDHVRGDITNRTYKEDTGKEHQIRKGKSVLVITFTSHYCYDSPSWKFFESEELSHSRSCSRSR